MLTFALLLLLLWCLVHGSVLVVWAVRGKRVCLEYSPLDLWQLIPYGLFVWVVLALLNGARP